jgi:hypothetical protein
MMIQKDVSLWALYKCAVADVAKLVDAPDLGSGAAMCESSSLSVRTKPSFIKMKVAPKNRS